MQTPTDKTLTEKLLTDHFVEGDFEPAEEIGIEIDQVLTRDTTGTIVGPVRAAGPQRSPDGTRATACAHQRYQRGCKNTDDHRFLRSAAGTFSAYFSRSLAASDIPFTGRIAAPGRIHLGANARTLTPGGLGQLAIGAGGLDIVVATGGAPNCLDLPENVDPYDIADELSDLEGPRIDVSASDISRGLRRDCGQRTVRAVGTTIRRDTCVQRGRCSVGVSSRKTISRSYSVSSAWSSSAGLHHQPAQPRFSLSRYR